MAANAMTTRLAAWIPRVAIILTFGGLIPLIWVIAPKVNHWFAVFCTLFVLRYSRFIGHIISHFLYKPSPIAENPRFDRSDVTVIVPTVDPNGPDFKECIRSIMANQPARIIVVTVGTELRSDCRRVLEDLAPESEGTAFSVSAIGRPSKRRQIARVMPEVETSITILADDHVFWPSRLFIPSVLAPFENERVANYLERHNWELRSSNAMDGGVFVVSGRTAVYRTDFLADSDLLNRFCNEKFFFGMFGKEGLGPDDDNFLTREIMKKQLLIRFQDTEDATIETTLGEWPKFHSQLLRWARTTFRSNPVMLFQELDFWKRYAWSALMVYAAGITNFAVVWDGLLIAFLVNSLKSENNSLEPASAGWLVLLLLWIVVTKIWKVVPALIRHPSDAVLVPFQIIFAYVHSFYKFWALLTFWDCDWSGRRLDDINAAENGQSGIMLDELSTIEITM